MRRSERVRRSDFGDSDENCLGLATAISAAPRRRLEGLPASVLRLALLILVGGASFWLPSAAAATPAIVVDAATGDVLYAEQATEPWFPASLTKLMTFYVAMSAVRDHKISLDTPIMISARAARAAPSKMGFKPGTELTLGNALEMLMVKSANDLAIAVAEAVSGSVEAFADDMNTTAAKLGMTQSHFENPNGLPNPAHVSSAHDLAVLARAIYADFPKEAQILDIGALRLGNEIIRNHNNLLGRYPGVDGMKTGFTCAAGFNLVTSAERQGHHYISVVLGAPNVHVRMLKTAVLLDRAFDGIDHPIEKLDALAGGGPGPAADLHNSVCRRRSKAIAAFQAQIKQLEAPLLALDTPAATPPAGPLALFAGGAQLHRLAPVAPTIELMPKPVFQPVDVYIGPAPGYQGPIAQARPPHSPVGTPLPPQAAVAEAPSKEAPGSKAAESNEHRRAMGDASTPKLSAKHGTKHLAARHKHTRKLVKVASGKSKKHHRHLAKSHGHKVKAAKLAAKAHDSAGKPKAAAQAASP